MSPHAGDRRDCPRATESCVAIENLDLSIPTGRRVAIFGRNGAGKSTLVNTILRTVDTYGGELRWNGQSLKRMRTEKVVRLGVGLVPQSRGLFYHQTVEENLRLGAYHAGVSRQVVYERIDQNVHTVSGTGGAASAAVIEFLLRR